MNSFTVTIKDITAWTITLRAADSLAAENAAWELFQTSADRSEVFAEDSDTTIQVEEVAS